MNTKIMLALLVASVPAVFGTPLILAPANVIGYYGQYSATFTASSILDNQAGPINEPAQDGSYWLNLDNGPVNAYIVIDLGALYHITSFDLFNTHNANFGDRGTGDFSIEAGNSIGVGIGSGFDLSGGFVTLVSGTLAAANPATNPLVWGSFGSSDNGFYRYIRFSPHTVASFNAPCCGANNYGLNELRIYEGAVSGSPEPAPLALLGGGFVALGLLRKRIARIG